MSQTHHLEAGRRVVHTALHTVVHAPVGRATCPGDGSDRYSYSRLKDCVHVPYTAVESSTRERARKTTRSLQENSEYLCPTRIERARRASRLRPRMRRRYARFSPSTSQSCYTFPLDSLTCQHCLHICTMLCCDEGSSTCHQRPDFTRCGDPNGSMQPLARRVGGLGSWMGRAAVRQIWPKALRCRTSHRAMFWYQEILLINSRVPEDIFDGLSMCFKQGVLRSVRCIRRRAMIGSPQL